MIIKLNTIGESAKAYQLEGGGWIPKAVVVSGNGLLPPYYELTDWFVNSLAEKKYNGTLSELDILTLNSLRQCIVYFHELPDEVKENWRKFWSGCSVTYNTKDRKYDHYNDMGAMNDMSFQDAYGDFGY